MPIVNDQTYVVSDEDKKVYKKVIICGNCASAVYYVNSLLEFDLGIDASEFPTQNEIKGDKFICTSCEKKLCEVKVIKLKNPVFRIQNRIRHLVIEQKGGELRANSR